MKTPDEYLRTDPAERRAMDPSIGLSEMLALPSLYYPGSGTDSGPLDVFTKHETVSTLVYCDYRVSQRSARAFLDSMPGWTVVRQEPLNPADFGVDDWEAFWPEEADLEMPERNGARYGLLTVLTENGGLRRACVISLCTEALQTYRLLSGRGFRPKVVVLQYHGTGGNWDPDGFGGESRLWEAAGQHHPKFLYVADNTMPWPKYKQVSGYGPEEGQPGHRRAVFRFQPRARTRSQRPSPEAVQAMSDPSEDSQRTHDAVVVRHGRMRAHIDEAIAPLVLETWKAGVETHCSCEDAEWHFADKKRGKWVQLGFPSFADAQAWLRIVAGHKKGGHSLYNRALSFVPRGSDCTSWRRRRWRWEISTRDTSADWGKDVVYAPTALDFLVFVYFTCAEVPLLVRRLRTHNVEKFLRQTAAAQRHLLMQSEASNAARSRTSRSTCSSRTRASPGSWRGSGWG